MRACGMFGGAAITVLALLGSASGLVLCTTPDGKTYAGDAAPPGCTVKSVYQSPPAVEDATAPSTAPDVKAELHEKEDNTFMADAVRRRGGLEKDINDAADKFVEAHAALQHLLETPDDWANQGRHQAYQNLKDNLTMREADARVRMDKCREDFKTLSADVREHFHGVLPASWSPALNCRSCP